MRDGLTEADVIEAGKDLALYGIHAIESGEAYECEAEYGEDAKLSFFLGTVMGQSPSGKYYQPWACSNVDLCDACKGEGCDACGHTGSVEAHLDELWQESMSETAGEADCWIESGEGDPCDIFICKAVETPEED